MSSAATIEKLIGELGIQHRVTRVSETVWTLQKGSATVQIVAAPEFVVATAVVAEHAPADDREAFYRRLLEANVGLYGAFFTLETNGSIRVNQVLLVDWLQDRELAFIVGNVASVADHWDDKLKQPG